MWEPRTRARAHARPKPRVKVWAAPRAGRLFKPRGSISIWLPTPLPEHKSRARAGGTQVPVTPSTTSESISPPPAPGPESRGAEGTRPSGRGGFFRNMGVQCENPGHALERTRARSLGWRVGGRRERATL